MTNEEIVNGLNKIQQNVYQNGFITKYEKVEWNCLALSARMNDMKIKKRKVDGKYIWYLVDESEVTEKRNIKFVCEWDNVDMSPNHKHLKGNCTTRAMAYVLRGEMDYDEIEAEQYRLADKKNIGSYHIRYHRNTKGVWEGVVLDRGYVKLRLRTPVRGDKIARALRDIGNPMISISASHASVIHNGKIVDSWDSRGKKVKELLVKDDNVSEVMRILGI